MAGRSVATGAAGDAAGAVAKSTWTFCGSDSQALDNQPAATTASTQALERRACSTRSAGKLTITTGPAFAASGRMFELLRYAEAVLAHAPERESLRQEVVTQWGERGLISLAFAVASGRLFPTQKYALGYAHSCARLDVNGEVAPFVRPASPPVPRT